MYAYTPKRHYLVMPLVVVAPVLLALFLSWRQGLDLYTFETYGYMFVAMLAGLMILTAFIKYRSIADLFDVIFRNYRRIAFYVVVTSLLLAGMSYLPAYSEPVLFIATLVSMVMGPSIGFMVPGLLTLLMSMVMDYSIQHIMFLMMMILVGSILDHDRLAGGLRTRWLFYTFLALSINTAFACLFYYMENSIFSPLTPFYAVVSAFISVVLVMAAETMLGRSASKRERYRLRRVMADDFILRAQMKSFDRAFYERSLFISRVAQAIAAHIGTDAELAAAAGFYYRLGHLGEKESVDNGIELALEYEFPGELIWIIYESRGLKRLPTTVPSGLVYLIESVISAFEINPQAKSDMDYELIVHKVTNTLSTEGKLDKSGLSMNNFITARDDLLKWGVEYEHRFRK